MFRLIIADINRELIRAAWDNRYIAVAGCRFVVGRAAGLDNVIARMGRKARIGNYDICAAQRVVSKEDGRGRLKAEHVINPGCV